MASLPAAKSAAPQTTTCGRHRRFGGGQCPDEAEYDYQGAGAMEG